jgi:M6 family metalloprotease-like protein
MSFPFFGKVFELPQPDGTTLKVKGWGDQHHAVFEALDGHTVVEDPATGFYHYASLSANGDNLVPTGGPAASEDPSRLSFSRHLRIRPEAARTRAMEAFHMMEGRRRCDIRRERRKAMLRRIRLMRFGFGPMTAPPRAGTLGPYKGLCILVEFPDVTGTIPKEEVEDFCNKQGYNGYGNNGSVYDYFLKCSRGRLEYKNVVTEYYTAQHPRSYYSDPSVPHGTRARELIREALADLKAKGFDFNQLSADSEGYIYAVNVYYAGACPNTWGHGLWPHAWALSTGFDVGQGRKAHDYQITHIGTELRLATFCHENGHMVCDFPDLYDYGHQSLGVGHYCLMCGGGADEKNPTEFCAYLKYKAGWADSVTPLVNGMQASASADKNEFFIYASNNATEYFIIENRHKSGRDAGLPDSGLAVWHVDELGHNDNEQMTASKHYECSLEQADNRFDLERNVNLGDADDLFDAANNNRFADTTTPGSKWWDGSPSGLDVHDIGAAGSTMSFSVGSGGGGQITKTSKPNLAIPDNDISGVQDTIKIAEDVAIGSIVVAVDITHTYRGDLVVALTAPSGIEVILHDRAGGGRDHLKVSFDVSSNEALRTLVGQSAQGDWTLSVKDLAAADTGHLKEWRLEIDPTVDAAVELDEAPGTIIPDDNTSGISRTLSTDAAGKVSNVSVSVDITHTYVSDLIVTLISPAGTEVDLHHMMGGETDNIIKTYTPTDTPGLETLVGEPIKGEWTLKVADVVGLDFGKLNSWRLRISS